MIIELGNHAAHRGVDDRPKVTTIVIPEADDSGLGGHTYKPGGISVAEFRDHLVEADLFNDGITQLPDHEALVSIARSWPSQSRKRPEWLKVTSHEDAYGDKIGHSKKAAADLESFLHEFYDTDGQGKPGDIEDRYWTKYGEPGVGRVLLPPAQNIFTNVGRVLQANSMGGGQLGYTSAVTAAGTTSITNSGATWTVNQWTGYRVYAWVSSGILVWGNIISNTSTVLTVDRWYNPATPGGSAGTTPGTAGGGMLIADGGMISAWFVGLTAATITPAAGDTSLASEIVTAGGGLVRKISPFAVTSGTSPMSYTLTPVYTANGSDSLPVTVKAIGVFNSMVVANTTSTMPFDTNLNASATLSTSGDQLTVTETVTGS